MAIMREMRRPWPELFDWDNLPGPFTWPLREGRHGMRIEDFIEGDRYVVRTEIPGVDPEKDITVDIDQGVLTIHAEREARRTEGGRSEFSYGSFVRRVALPEGADDSAVKAKYEAGILEVSVPISSKPAEARRIPIESGS